MTDAAIWNEGIDMIRTCCALDQALNKEDVEQITELAGLLSELVKREVGARAEEEGWIEEYNRATSHEHWKVDTTVDPYGPVAFPVRVVPASSETTGKANTYLRSFRQALEDRGWRVLEGSSGHVFTLTYEPTLPGVDPEFTVPFDMRGRNTEDPQAWIEAARGAAATDTVFWSGGLRKDEPGWISEKIKHFKETQLSTLPQIALRAVERAIASIKDDREIFPEYCTIVDPEDLHELVVSGEKGWRDPRHLGIFVAKDREGYTVADNTGGECFVEFFSSAAAAAAYAGGADPEDALALDRAVSRLDAVGTENLLAAIEGRRSETVTAPAPERHRKI